MKKIPLTQKQFALVDDENFKWLNQWKWYFSNGYAMRGFRKNGKIIRLLMHREILKTPKGKDTDHINSNKLDYCPFVDWKSRNFYFSSERNIQNDSELNSIDGIIDIANDPMNGFGNIYKIGLDKILNTD